MEKIECTLNWEELFYTLNGEFPELDLSNGSSRLIEAYDRWMSDDRVLRISC